TDIDSSINRAVDFANAVHLIDHANKWGDFTYGKQSWDAIVFQWVPAQIVGQQFKRSLMFENGRNYEQIGAEYGFSWIVGTTMTGFAFCYQEFGVFGAS